MTVVPKNMTRLFPQKLIGRFLLFLWLAACLAVLLLAYIQREIHDTDVAFAYLMIYLTFPLGYALGVLVGFVFMVIYYLFGVEVPGGFLSNLCVWIFLVLTGYFQWFVLVPWIYQQIKKSSLKKASGRKADQ